MSDNEPGQEDPDDYESDYEEQQEMDIGDNDDENGPRLSLETNENEEKYDEEEERRRYGLNSPKAKNNDQPTPNTKFRQEADINSPKQQKKLDWSMTNKEETEENEDGDNNALQSLVTQVQRTDDKKQTSESPITQVDRDDDSIDQRDIPHQTSSGGFCSCLCNLFSCCSPTPPTTTTEDKPRTHIDNNKQSKKSSSTLQQGEEPGTNETQREDDEESSSEEPTGLLPPLSSDKKGKKCLVLDLDETLVHSSFKPITTADFIIPVEIDNVIHKVYVMKRPYVDEFLVECAKYYEIVIFTASLSKYADPLLDELDKHKTISHRLFRESCVLHGTAYVKDLRKLGRKLKDTIIVDNSAQSYLFQPKSAVPILSWFDDKTDTQLRDFLPVLKTTLNNCKDVRNVLDANNKTFKWLCNQANVPLTKFEP